MLDDIFIVSIRGSLSEKEMIRAVEVSDDLQWLAEGTNARLWDPIYMERIVPVRVPHSLVGAWDPDPNDLRWIYRDTSSAASDKSASQEDEGYRAARYITWAIESIKARALDKQVYAANTNYLISILTSAGHLSATFDTLADHAVPNDAGLNPRQQIWHVHRDSSLSSFHRGEAGYAGDLGVEISSPILQDRPADFEKIFDVLCGGVRPMLDPSCGFHVHVGNIRGFSLRSLKKIATLVRISELVLYSLVERLREANDMTVPLGKDSTLACTEDLPEYTTDFVLQSPNSKGAQMGAMRLSNEIEAHVPKDSIPQVSKTRFPKSAGISFLSIRRIIEKQSGEEEPSYEGTVKFRMLEGTLDPELIAHWTKLVLRILERGTDTEPVEYFCAMENILKNTIGKV
ncbi:uncharacterized protein LY79DRAFT_706455 [Colletotrichum navitas]|uniref:Amidoligase enzyme n=1 Tax=Colletotrichum navitas TaxID=681940 RepID=A0AAD8UZ21_9PEZI|nr:uncharacterized protein LY79DRAFT_706455 [Colletotrichum navitas]KAK1574451.1 hypothetical protein LY79DRAFT_706455 [Colletotrichum navitas]